MIKKHALIFLSLLFIAAAFLPLNSVAEKWKPETLPMVFLQNDHRFVCNPDAVLSDSDIMRHYPYTFDESRVRSWIEKNI